MIADQVHSDHPYGQFEGTRQWSVLDRALSELIKNSDLEEKTRREYIVGFLCNALSANEQDAKAYPADDSELSYVQSTIAKAQEMMRRADPCGASMTQELLAERRRDAARE